MWQSFLSIAFALAKYLSRVQINVGLFTLDVAEGSTTPHSGKFTVLGLSLRGFGMSGTLGIILDLDRLRSPSSRRGSPTTRAGRNSSSTGTTRRRTTRQVPVVSSPQETSEAGSLRIVSGESSSLTTGLGRQLES